MANDPSQELRRFMNLLEGQDVEPLMENPLAWLTRQGGRAEHKEMYKMFKQSWHHYLGKTKAKPKLETMIKFLHYEVGLEMEEVEEVFQPFSYMFPEQSTDEIDDVEDDEPGHLLDPNADDYDDRFDVPTTGSAPDPEPDDVADTYRTANSYRPAGPANDDGGPGPAPAGPGLRPLPDNDDDEDDRDYPPYPRQQVSEDRILMENLARPITNGEVEKILDVATSMVLGQNLHKRGGGRNGESRYRKNSSNGYGGERRPASSQTNSSKPNGPAPKQSNNPQHGTVDRARMLKFLYDNNIEEDHIREVKMKGRNAKSLAAFSKADIQLLSLVGLAYFKYSVRADKE